MMKLKPQILHISCHGYTNESGNYLVFESDTGEAMKMTETNLKEALDLTDVDIDVVIIAACQSEFVGELFKENGAKNVICVDKNGSVLDEAAIDFTLNLY